MDTDTPVQSAATTPMSKPSIFNLNAAYQPAFGYNSYQNWSAKLYERTKSDPIVLASRSQNTSEPAAETYSNSSIIEPGKETVKNSLSASTSVLSNRKKHLLKENEQHPLILEKDCDTDTSFVSNVVNPKTPLHHVRALFMTSDEDSDSIGLGSPAQSTDLGGVKVLTSHPKYKEVPIPELNSRENDHMDKDYDKKLQGKVLTLV